jgi:hypothetical protein
MIYTLYLVDNNSSITETISLDVINSFGEDYSSNIAQNTVENGYVISDSISISNPKFSVSGVITDSKFRVSGHLVVFNGNTFEKSQGDSREQFQQISDDDYADKVKDRLIKLWENKEIFGILESKDINNIKGSQVRNIFPCVLSSLSFNKSDAASAIYPTLSVERIRYAVVTVGTVKDPTPELIPKYKESIEAQSKTSSGTATVASELANADAQAKAALKGISGDDPETNPVRRNNEINLNRTAQASGQAEFNNLGADGRRAAIQQYGSEANAVKAYSEKIFKSLAEGEGYKGATFTPR